MSALELRDSCERSARLDTMLQADARKRHSDMKVLTLGHKRSTMAKQLRSHFGDPFNEDQSHEYRESIVKYVVTDLLRLVEDVETNGAGFATEQARRHVHTLKEFSDSMECTCIIDEEVSIAVRYLWRNFSIRQSFRHSMMDETSL